MKSIVVVNDVRAVPLMAALHIARASGSGDDVRLVASARTLRARDYGPSLYPRFYNALKTRYLQHRHSLVLVPVDPATSLSLPAERGVLSSLCSITCDSGADAIRYPDLFADLEALAKGAIEINAYLEAEPPDCVYVFNGRTAAQYPIVHFCKERGIALRYYEYAEQWDGFNLYDFPPHFGYKVGERMVERSREIGLDDERYSEAAERFRRAKLASRHAASFKSDAAERFDVVAFLSSDFEYTNLDEELCGVQTVGNLGLCRAVHEKYGNTHSIAVRAHPNQRHDPSADVVLAPVEAFCAAHGIRYFGPDSDVSSYSLIERAQVVAVDCSTIGVDAILLGTDVDVFGQNDLAAVLDSLPQDKRRSMEYLQHYVPRVMVLANEIFRVGFSRREHAVVKILAQIDRLMYHLQRLARRWLVRRTSGAAAWGSGISQKRSGSMRRAVRSPNAGADLPGRQTQGIRS